MLNPYATPSEDICVEQKLLKTSGDSFQLGFKPTRQEYMYFISLYKCCSHVLQLLDRIIIIIIIIITIIITSATQIC